MKLENREFGCYCDGDSSCEYKAWCENDLLQHKIWILESQLQTEKDKNTSYKIYYAHHLWKYGTEIEKYELEIIRNKFTNSIIINPNGDVSQDNEETEIMKDCISHVEDCDILIFSSLTGVVGKGVISEVNKAKELNKRVYYIKDNELKDAKYCRFKELGISNRIFANVENV